MKKICEYCKNEFVTYPCRNYKFCSIKCYSAFKQITNEKHCKICNKIFSVSPSKRIYKNQFCSRECFYKSISGKDNYQWKNREILTCLNCGKKFKVRIAPSQIGRKKFCSRRCNTIFTLHHFISRSETLPEQIVKNFLIVRKIPFKSQVPIKDIGIVDFLIKDILVIECDGDYWHSLAEVKKRDWRKNMLLRLNAYPTLRFSESQIHNKTQLWQTEILNIYSKIKETFN